MYTFIHGGLYKPAWGATCLTAHELVLVAREYGHNHAVAISLLLGILLSHDIWHNEVERCHLLLLALIPGSPGCLDYLAPANQSVIEDVRLNVRLSIAKQT